MGFSILWIMFFHCYGDYSRFPMLEAIKNFGNLGVDIFLLLSGVGLYYSVQRLRRENGERWIIPYFKRRFMRIIPATIICLLPWYCYLYRGQNVSAIRFLLDITSLSYWIDGSNRGWYVALTIVLYAFYPLLYTTIVKWKDDALLYCAMLIAIIIAVNTAIAILKPEWFGAVSLALCRVPVFIGGCFLALIVLEKSELRWLPLGCFLMASFLFVFLKRFIEPLRIYGTWRYLYGILGFCVTVVLSVVFRHIHGKWLSKLFCFFGKYTLELYLTHTQILTVLWNSSKINLSGTMTNVLAVGCSIIVAYIVHEGLSFVEKTSG